VVAIVCGSHTNIDPFNASVFERFLNSDRVSLPDIDIDFDDEGRSKWIMWTQKYGSKTTSSTNHLWNDTAKSADLRYCKSIRFAPLKWINSQINPNLIPGKWSFIEVLRESEGEIKKTSTSRKTLKIRELIEFQRRFKEQVSIQQSTDL
jgi:DNA polymerase-3 subunit alpha